MKKIICILLCLFAFRAMAADYFVNDRTGNDTNSGLSPVIAWKSLDRVNTATLLPGDRVFFARDGVWRGQLIPVSGSKSGTVIYVDYGEGEKPLILGSENRSAVTDWVDEGNNIWKSAAAFTTDVGNLIFGQGSSFGFKKWADTELLKQGDFCFDKDSLVVRIYSIGNPANVYHDIECAIRRDIIDETGKSYILYRNLALRYGGDHGIGGGNTHHITVSCCDISYTGGGDLDGVTNTRFGNGIEFWANAHDNVVERCRIYEIYDSGLTNQNKEDGVQQFNIIYRNNMIWNCSMASYEYFNRPASSSAHRIYFINNTCVNSGYGWGGEQRPDPKGGGILVWSTEAPTDSMFFLNNIICRARRTLVFVDPATMPLSGLFLDYNCYRQDVDSTVAEIYPTRYDSAHFSQYREATGWDGNSFIADPRFTEPLAMNFHILGNSPCIDHGINVDNRNDIDGDARVADSIDIGADEFHRISGIAEGPGKGRFRIYPVPVQTELTIVPSEQDGELQITISDMLGVVRKQAWIFGPTKVDVSALPSGIYFISDQHGSCSSRTFIKN